MEKATPVAPEEVPQVPTGGALQQAALQVALAVMPERAPERASAVGEAVSGEYA